MSEKEKEPEKEKPEEGKGGLSDTETKLLAITILIFTICATFSSLKASGFTRNSILAQNQATDLWTFYQAKSLKENIYQVEVDRMLVEQKEGTFSAADKEMLEKAQAKIEKYKTEEAEIMAEAKSKEEARDHALQLNGMFAGGITFLQIAIVICSLTAILKKKAFWAVGSIFGLIGLFKFVQAMMAI